MYVLLLAAVSNFHQIILPIDVSGVNLVEMVRLRKHRTEFPRLCLHLILMWHSLFIIW